jgi:FkbM family methyltransferase
MSILNSAQFVLFEPQPVHSKSLDALAASSRGRVIPVKKAVGAEDGSLLFDISDPFGGGPATGSENALQVEQTTLDSTVTGLQLEEPFLLKLDTHGFEKSILQGGDLTLTRCTVLVIEAYNYRIARESLLFWELCAFLAERGFRPIDLVDLMHRKYDNSLWQMDLFFIRSSWEGFNHVTYT